MRDISRSSRFARRVSGLFLILSILLLVYTFYRSAIVFHGLRNDTYFKYHLISLLGIFFWGGVLRLKDEIRLKIIMVATSLAMSVYLAEVCFHFLGSVAEGHGVLVARRIKAAKAIGVKYNTQTKHQFYLNLKANGIDAVPSIHPSEQFAKANGVPGKKPLFPWAVFQKKLLFIVMKAGNTLSF